MSGGAWLWEQSGGLDSQAPYKSAGKPAESWRAYWAGLWGPLARFMRDRGPASDQPDYGADMSATPCGPDQAV